MPVLFLMKNYSYLVFCSCDLDSFEIVVGAVVFAGEDLIVSVGEGNTDGFGVEGVTEEVFFSFGGEEVITGFFGEDVFSVPFSICIPEKYFPVKF
jgi:hypothetical protein